MGRVPVPITWEWEGIKKKLNDHERRLLEKSYIFERRRKAKNAPRAVRVAVPEKWYKKLISLEAYLNKHNKRIYIPGYSPARGSKPTIRNLILMALYDRLIQKPEIVVEFRPKLPFDPKKVEDQLRELQRIANENQDPKD